MSTAIHVIPEPLPVDGGDAVSPPICSPTISSGSASRWCSASPATPSSRMLDALGRSRIRYVSTRHEQVAAHAADGYARAIRQARRAADPSRPGPDQRGDRRRQRRARLDPDGRDRRRRASRTSTAAIRTRRSTSTRTRTSSRSTARSASASTASTTRAICRASWSARSISRRPAGPGPVLVDVPMDVFSASLPVDAFNKVPAEIARPTIDDGDGRADRRGAGRAPSARCSTPAAACSRRARRRSSLALAEALELPIAHTLMGKGVRARGSSAAARHDRLLGHADREREVPDGGRDPRRRHAARRSQLELVGSAVHVRHPADAPDPHRRRRRRDRPQLPDRARRRRRRQARARRAREPRAGRARTARAARCAPRSPRGRRAFAANWANHYSSDQYPMRPERILSELRKAVPEDGFIVTDVGWNKNGVGQQFPITVPGTFITPSGLATMGFGPAAALGVKLAQPDRAVVALDRRRRLRQQPVGGRDRDGSRARRGLAGDGQRRVRHDRRPDEHALRLGVRLPVRIGRRALPDRLRADGQGLRRATACSSTRPTSSGRRWPRRSPPAGRRSSRRRWRTRRRRRRGTGTSTTSTGKGASCWRPRPSASAPLRARTCAGSRSWRSSPSGR